MRKKKNKIYLLLILLLGIGIAFAALATTLKINGTALINKNTWRVYWTNPQVVTGSVSSTLPTITNDEGEEENTKAVWTATLRNPEDFYEFTIDAVNAGSIDAMVTDVTLTSNNGEELPEHINYSITYLDGKPVSNNQKLGYGLKETYLVDVHYDITKMTTDEINSIPDEGIEYEFTLEVTYGMATEEVIKSDFEVGDYFELVPDMETATTSTPGFSGTTPTADQTLWRVIRLNADGTVDAVSEYISTNNITITGVDGYRNLIKGLQDIASCYAKEDYTESTRMMGYGGQTLSIEDTYYFNGVINTAPQTTDTPSPTTGGGHEYKGGVTGDTLYLRDYQLVRSTYNNSLSATKNGGSSGSYWLASRFYDYSSATTFYYNGRYINGNNLNSATIRRGGSSWSNSSPSYAVRPIITLKEGITKASGTGIKTDPYILN